jgi:hypothetical protein
MEIEMRNPTKAEVEQADKAASEMEEKTAYLDLLEKQMQRKARVSQRARLLSTGAWETEEPVDSDDEDGPKTEKKVVGQAADDDVADYIKIYEERELATAEWRAMVARLRKACKVPLACKLDLFLGKWVDRNGQPLVKDKPALRPPKKAAKRK